MSAVAGILAMADVSDAECADLALLYHNPRALIDRFLRERRIEEPKAPGRNDPCPCGSGRKFKKCHG